VSINQQKQIQNNPNKRNKCRRCPKCYAFLIRFGGQEWSNDLCQNVSFTIGRICKRCGLLYINPKFADCRIIFHDIGGVIKPEV